MKHKTMTRLLNAWAAMAEKWSESNKAYDRTAERRLLVNPNYGSTIKVEHYELALSEDVVIGTKHVFENLSGCPKIEQFKPTSLVINVPCVFFAYITKIQGANVSVSLSENACDAYTFNALATRSHLHLPTMYAVNELTVRGYYTGLVPILTGNGDSPIIAEGETVTITATFFGPSTIC